MMKKQFITCSASVATPPLPMCHVHYTQLQGVWHKGSVVQMGSAPLPAEPHTDYKFCYGHKAKHRGTLQVQAQELVKPQLDLLLLLHSLHMKITP